VTRESLNTEFFGLEQIHLRTVVLRQPYGGDCPSLALCREDAVLDKRPLPARALLGF